MKEVLTLDLSYQGYENTLDLNGSISDDKIQTIKNMFSNMFPPHENIGLLFGTTFEIKEHKLIAKIDAIMPKERISGLQQNLLYRVMPQLGWDRFHNKFQFSVATSQLPEYTNSPKRNIIKQIGVELEGGWREFYPHMKGDGSVSGMRHGTHAGEIAFPPFAPDEFPWVEQVALPPYQNIRSGMKGSFTSLYPDYVNHTCGMHVHISFPSRGMYTAFVDARFTPWLVRGLQRWGEIGKIKSKHFYSRLAGRQSYCLDTYSPENQLVHGLVHGGERYSIVNYCFSRHGTMEIRVLPMFKDVRFAIKAIKALIKLVNLWGCAFGPTTDGEKVRLTSFTEEEIEKPKPPTKTQKLDDYDIVYGLYEQNIRRD